ncbi:single-stranded DNA-binding protein [Schaalia sp. ZJ1691]|uniref:single-stranded DNA-binding protein n=1 Tax=Schaalia sp. ZJ1691 TaxID=2709404 RepID=UPI0013ED5C72|nr:single-stranded DNA-binding protein [Schaalia sp. ZJ1691]
MAGETVITIIGNLTSDPELKYTTSGVPFVSFSVASTPRTYDREAGEYRDGETLFMQCSLWRNAAENVSQSLKKGMRVIVQGRLVQRNFETRQGERRSSIQLQVDEIGPSLRYATAQVQRVSTPGGGSRGGYQGQGVGGGDGYQPRDNGGYQGGSQANYGAPAGGSAEDPWRTPDQGGSTSFMDEPPF